MQDQILIKMIAADIVAHHNLEDAIAANIID